MSGNEYSVFTTSPTNSLGCHLRHLNTDSQLMDESGRSGPLPSHQPGAGPTLNLRWCTNVRPGQVT